MTQEIIDQIADSNKMRFVGLAGPGTGKSTTFQTIVGTDIFKEKKVLILSFINKLVDGLKDDFKNYTNVTVSTLHSFALSEYQRITNASNVVLVDDLDSIISTDYKLIKEIEINYSKKICELNLNLDEEEFYKKRSSYYAKNGKIYSFNSVIYSVNKIYESKPELIPETYDLVLIDEFQDFNPLEYEFIKHLNSKNKVVLVGDDDQSLYDWKFAQPSLIRNLYKDEDSVPFSLDYCFRCPEVIVEAVNSLIVRANERGWLSERIDDKKFIYPHKPGDDSHKTSELYPHIYFVRKKNGDQLIYELSKSIRKDVGEEKEAKVLIITPPYLKQRVYIGLVSKGLNVIDYELFADEKQSKIKHKEIFKIFETLSVRKTDRLMLRKSLPLYYNNSKIKTIVAETCSSNKEIWNILSGDIKKLIEYDTELYKKVRLGKVNLTSRELERFSKLFNLKNIISRMVNGFGIVQRDAQEVELATVMKSKGLSADFVYYIGIDDSIMTDSDTGDLTDQKICEFLVGITRTKKKLTLFSLYDNSPKILDLVDSKLIKATDIERARG